MTRRLTLPASGSMAAHDALMEAFVTWRLRQSASDLMWTNHAQADDTSTARNALLGHAMNCGFEIERHGDLIKWSAKWVNAWGQSIGVPAMEIALVLGEEAAGAQSYADGVVRMRGAA